MAAAGVALAAGCLAASPVSFGALSFTPVPATTLVTRRDLTFKVAHESRGRLRTTVLAHDGADGRPVPVARIYSRQVASGPLQVAVQRLPGPTGLLDVVALEHLYALTLRLDPEARYCLAQARGACDPARSGTSHGAFLRSLAQAREHAVAAAGGTLGAAPWHVVSLAPTGMNHQADEVSVRVAHGGKSLAGVRVFFHRAPHSSCSAATDARGTARCTLIDQHGDEEEHAGEHDVPAVVTYPGEIRAERALLPTTLVLKPKR